MRAKQSFTASGMQSCFGVVTPYLTNHAVAFPVFLGGTAGIRTESRGESLTLEPRRTPYLPTTSRGEGLLHDARNLVGTIGLYCDLLSMPGVLKPEHRQYPEELRLLGARSKSLIEHLMQSLFAIEDEATSDDTKLPSCGKIRARCVEGEVASSIKPTSLRSIVERCSGLLSRVANGAAIKITYGPAAAARVKVPEEAIERILVNLVRNAAAAMGRPPSKSAQIEGDASEIAPHTIRILVGPIINRVGEHKPWPFQRVRLVVEDAGCGMNSQQMERLVSAKGTRSSGGHGVGFCVVRDLVAASNGEIRVISEPEVGTRVQVEWPIAAMSEEEVKAMDILDLLNDPPAKNQFPPAVKTDSASRGLASSRPTARSEGTR